MQNNRGTVISDPFEIQSGVLGIKVWIDTDKESIQIDVEDCAAARCIEEEDGLFWSDTHAFWSNRSRTVRDIPLKRLTKKTSGQSAAPKTAKETAK